MLDYLAQEVFEQQPPAVQTFLLKTSILTRLTGPLCDAVTGDANGQEMLEQLAAANLFVIRLDDRREWYRYHRLFVDLLRYRLPQAGINEQVLHRRASAWYEQVGLIDQAIKYALAAQDYDRVKKFLLSNLPAFFFDGKKSLLLDWIRALPADIIDGDPLLGLAAAWILFLNGNMTASARHLDKVEPQLTDHPVELPELPRPNPFPISHPTAAHIPGIVAALRGQLLFLQGNPASAIEQFRTALDHLPPDAPGIRGMITQHLGMAYWLNGDFQAAERIYLEFQPQAGHDIGRVFVTLNQADRHHIRGNLGQAAALYQHAIALAERSTPGLIAAASAELGLVHYEWNELESAEQYLRDAIRLGEHDISVKALGMGHYGLSMVLGATGRFDEAFETYEKLVALTGDMDLGMSTPIIKTALFKLLIDQGDLARLRREMQTFAFAGNTSAVQSHLRADWAIGHAHFALGRLDDALRLGRQFLAHKTAGYDLVSTARIRALLALVYQQHGDALQWHQLLTQALTVAQPENMRRTFLDYGHPMADLLAQFRKTARRDAVDRPLSAFVETLLADFPHATPPAEPASAAQPLPEPLTERELEVLQLMAGGLTNKEISRQLVITTGTVKVHTSHIYGKLEVNNRTQAVAKARSLGLLE
ncbi:MAG: hypothetical protein Kow0031_33500 [Anaerolineae bacterium]